MDLPSIQVGLGDRRRPWIRLVKERFTVRWSRLLSGTSR